MDKVEEARKKYLADKKAGKKIDIDLSWTDIERIPEWVPDKIDGSFNCSYCPNLTSLEGAPEIDGDFYCTNCPNLSSLKGAPKTVISHFDCHGCLELTSLEGAPNIVEGNFYCSECPKLYSVEGIGEVKGEFKSDFMTNEEFLDWKLEKQLNKKALDSLNDELKDAGDVFSSGI